MTTFLILANLATLGAFLWKREQWCVLWNEKSNRDDAEARRRT